MLWARHVDRNKDTERDAKRWRFVKDIMLVSILGEEDGDKTIVLDSNFEKFFEKVYIKFYKTPTFEQLVDLMMEIQVVVESESAIGKMMGNKNGS